MDLDYGVLILKHFKKRNKMVKAVRKIKEGDIYFHEESKTFNLGNKHYVIDEILNSVSEVELKNNEKFNYVDVTRKAVGKYLIDLVKTSQLKKNDN